jgi:hypothetical protein
MRQKPNRSSTDLIPTRIKKSRKSTAKKVLYAEKIIVQQNAIRDVAVLRNSFTLLAFSGKKNKA